MSWLWYLAAMGWMLVAASCVHLRKYDLATLFALMSLLMMASGIASAITQAARR